MGDEKESMSEQNENSAEAETQTNTSSDSGTTSRKVRPITWITAIINGAGVGFLLGALVGLSISPVVSGVIGTLSGMLAVLLGLSEKYISPVKSVRIGAFGFFCVAGILTGLYIRTNNALLPDRETMLKEYMAVGFTKQEALDFIAFREFNLVPAGWKNTGTDVAAVQDSGSVADNSTENSDPVSDGNTAVNTPTTQSSGRVFASANDAGAERKSVLYSSEVSVSDCDLINNADASQDVSEIMNSFELAGGTWAELAGNMKSAGLPDKVFANAIIMIRDCFCASDKKTGTLKVTYDPGLKSMGTGNTVAQIEALITPKDNLMFAMKEKISKNISSEFQKIIYLAIIKTFCHE